MPSHRSRQPRPMVNKGLRALCRSSAPWWICRGREFYKRSFENPIIEERHGRHSQFKNIMHRKGRQLRPAPTILPSLHASWTVAAQVRRA